MALFTIEEKPLIGFRLQYFLDFETEKVKLKLSCVMNNFSTPNCTVYICYGYYFVLCGKTKYDAILYIYMKSHTTIFF